MLGIALGVEATRRRHRMLFTRAADLVQSLLEARDERRLTPLQQRYQKVALLVVDELGFVPFERAGGEPPPFSAMALMGCSFHVAVGSCHVLCRHQRCVAYSAETNSECKASMCRSSAPRIFVNGGTSPKSWMT
jgi:hypothetical protein